MTSYIKKPIKNQNWHPSKGNFINKEVIKEEKIVKRKERKKKIITFLLLFSHVVLLAFLFIFM